MPFHNDVYYPYTNGIQGSHGTHDTHLSARPPSLLNSTTSQYPRDRPSPCSLGMTSSSSFAFRFRPRKAIVDWQQIHSVDINLVMKQLDVDVLQEFINMVTFCSLEGERCQRCRTPVDPALLKILQLAQLTIEWLLHCQEVLNVNLNTMQEKLVVTGREHMQLLDQQAKQAEKVKVLEAELKQRRKDVYNLQSQLFSSAQKCHLCNKAFLTPTFLQRHMQRRHPEERQSQLMTDNEKKSPTESLKLEISNLREKNSQLQQSLHIQTAQENPSTHKVLTGKLDNSEEEQITCMERKMQEAGEVRYRKTEMLCTQRSTPMNRNLEQHLKLQAKMCDSRLRKLKAQHESKTNQLQQEMNKFSMSKQQEHQQLQREMRCMQQEIQPTARTQRKQKTNVSSHLPAKVMEEPGVVSATAPEPKPKRFVLKPRTPEPGPDKAPWLNGMTRALKSNPIIKKEIQKEREQDVKRRLEILGVKRDQSGLRNKELTSFLAKVYSNQDTIAKVTADYRQCREEIACTVDEKMRGLSRQASPDSPAVSKDKRPQLAPGMAATNPNTMAPIGKMVLKTLSSKTSPFSSESEIDNLDPEMEPPKIRHRGISHRHKTKRVKPVQIKAGKATSVQNRRAVAKQLVSSSAAQPQGLVRVKTAVMKTESDDDEDDRSDLIEKKEVHLKQLSENRNQRSDLLRAAWESY